MIRDTNHAWEENPLYVLKPFVFFTNGVHDRRMITMPFYRKGRLMNFNKIDDRYTIMWYPIFNEKPLYLDYTYERLMTKPELFYGYRYGETVQRVTDGKTRTIKRSYVEDGLLTTEVEEEFGYFSYNLFIPLPIKDTTTVYQMMPDDLFAI